MAILNMAALIIYSQISSTVELLKLKRKDLQPAETRTLQARRKRF